MQQQPNHVITFENASQPPRVVTSPTRSAALPRVPAGDHPPRNLSNDFLDLVNANNIISDTTMPVTYTVLHPDMGKSMEYMDIMKIPALKPLWRRGFGNECGQLFQGIRDIKGMNTCFFVELKKILKDRTILITKLV
jgi:hypothetical protein